MAITPTQQEQDGAGLLADFKPTPAGAPWYLLAVSGAVSAVIGAVVLAYPDPSVKLLGVFVGIDLLIGGTLLVARGFADGSDEAGGVAEVVIGILALVAGLIVIRNPGESVVLVAVAFAIYLVVHGAVVMSRGLIHHRNRMATLARGAVLAIAGTVILCWPDISLKTLTVLAGIALLLQGVVALVEAFHQRSHPPATAS